MQEEETKTEAELEQEGTEVEEQENQEVAEPTETPTLLSSSEDPLDNLSQEELLAEAKKFRSISQRKEKKPQTETKTVEVKTNVQGQFMTRKEYERVNEKQAIELFREEYPDLVENETDVFKLYVNRNGRDTSREILKDLRDAAVLWTAKNSKAAEETARIIGQTSVAKPSGSGSKPVKQEKEDPRFASKPSFEDFYKSQIKK